VYFSEDAPVAILEEVQEQLQGAYTFIQDREAEAPAQYRAVQVRMCACSTMHMQYLPRQHQRLASNCCSGRRTPVSNALLAMALAPVII
jgi:hypothetical protein